MAVLCDYCGNEAELVTGLDVYPHRHDLHEKKFYKCRPCKAWVGCHPGTEKPLGRLANAELRKWKSRAHQHFDPRWQRKGKKARRRQYRWLANHLKRQGA